MTALGWFVAVMGWTLLAIIAVLVFALAKVVEERDLYKSVAEAAGMEMRET